MKDEDIYGLFIMLIVACFVSIMISQCEQASELKNITHELRLMNLEN